MEQTVVFEQKVYLTPKDMNRMASTHLDEILLEHLRDSLENKCSQHGFVLPGSLELISRSMGHLDNGRFTGNVVFHAQVRGSVYNPANGTRLTGTILKKNKMGLYVVYKDAIRVLVARDLHRDSEEFEELQVGDVIQIEIRKSRFQIRDPFILSIGMYLSKSEKPDVVELPAAVAAATAVPAAPSKEESPKTPNSLPELEVDPALAAAAAKRSEAPAASTAAYDDMFEDLD
jgi:hypothetical protein